MQIADMASLVKIIVSAAIAMLFLGIVFGFGLAWVLFTNSTPDDDPADRHPAGWRGEQ